MLEKPIPQPATPLPAERAVVTRDVLMVAPTMFFADYGCHVRILEESLSLRRLGHRLRIVAYPNGRDIAGLPVRRCHGVPFNYRVIVGSSRHKFYLDAQLELTLLHEITTRPPDLIHAHLHEGALLGWAGMRLRRRPLLFDLQGSLTAEMIDHGWLRPGGVRHRAMRWVESLINQLPDAIITSSTQAADMLVSDFGLSRERVFPLLDSVNTESFRLREADDAADLAALRAAYGIPEGKRVVLYLGLLAEYQGTGLLLYAAQRLLAHRDDLHLLIMGFPNEARYAGLAASLGIARHVTFTGRLPYDQAARHLRLGDIAVAPKMSATEGSGKLLNYMAVGLPTVAFDNAVNREYLGDLGHYPANDSPRAFADALDELLDNPREWPARGTALRRRVRTHFSWESAGVQISQIYDLISK